jgi:hypothetical protein
MDLLERWITVCPVHGPAYRVSRTKLEQGCWYWSSDYTHCGEKVEYVLLTDNRGAVDALREAEKIIDTYARTDRSGERTTWVRLWKRRYPDLLGGR